MTKTAEPDDREKFTARQRVVYALQCGAGQHSLHGMTVVEVPEVGPYVTVEGGLAPVYDVLIRQTMPGVNNIVVNRYRLELTWIGVESESERGTCCHCGRPIVNDPTDGWVDPEATGDDSVWRETCDRHDTFTAEHEPEIADPFTTLITELHDIADRYPQMSQREQHHTVNDAHSKSVTAWAIAVTDDQRQEVHRVAKRLLGAIAPDLPSVIESLRKVHPPT